MLESIGHALIAIVSVLSFLGGLICAVFAIRQFMKIIRHIRPEKKSQANYLGPLTLFLPDFFDRQGVRYKGRFIAYFASAGGFFFVFIVLVLVFYR